MARRKANNVNDGLCFLTQTERLEQNGAKVSTTVSIVRKGDGTRYVYRMVSVQNCVEHQVPREGLARFSLPSLGYSRVWKSVTQRWKTSRVPIVTDFWF